MTHSLKDTVLANFDRVAGDIRNYGPQDGLYLLAEDILPQTYDHTARAISLQQAQVIHELVKSASIAHWCKWYQGLGRKDQTLEKALEVGRGIVSGCFNDNVIGSNSGEDVMFDRAVVNLGRLQDLQEKGPSNDAS